MRIAFVSAIFPPEPEPSSVMAGELVRAWARAGHTVTVICPSPNRPQGVAYPEHPRRAWTISSVDGARCIRVWTWFIGPERRHIDRILENVTFGLSSTLALLFTRRPDVVILDSWPVLATAAAVAVCIVRRLKFVNYVKDIYPEAAVAAGILPRTGILTSVVRLVDRWICQRAAKNVVLSEGVAGFLSETRAVAADKISIIPDWLDLTFIKPTAGGPGWRQEIGLSADDIVFMFAGTLGHASRVDILVDVAEKLRGHDRIRLVCVGQGPLKPRMEAETQRRGLHNLLLVPFQPRERVSDMQSAADVMLLTTSAEMGASSVPSKLITYLAVGKPVICAVPSDSDIATLVERSQVGLVVPPEEPTTLADAILQMARQSSSQRAEIGCRARTVALERHSLEGALLRFQQLFEDFRLPD